jgi:NTE family protein
MTTNRFCILTSILAFLLLPQLPALGQERPKVGLALSGGAARGFVHVGVIKVLEEVGMPIDCIAGCSMGAVIGGFYAAGYTVAEMESLAVHVDWDGLFSDTVGRRPLAMAHKRWDARYAVTFPMDGVRPVLPTGLIAGQKITKLFCRLTVPVQNVDDFRELPYPYMCVATDIETGEVIQLDHGDLADAMRTSMAIPSLFTPVVIDGRLLVDGGVARNLPAQDALDLGADIVIGVEANAPPYKKGELNSMMRIMDQAIHFQISGTSREQRELCDLLIVPEADRPGYDFGQAAYFIEQGEAAARAILPRLRALADSLRALSQPQPHWKPARPESILVTDVRIEGVEKTPARVVEMELNIATPQRMSIDAIDDAIDQIYKYDYFERVGYSLKPEGDGTRLTVNVVEKSENLFRAGLRYDNETNLAVLMNVTLRDVGIRGSALALDVSLGEDHEGDLRYFFPAGRSIRAFGLQARANASRSSIGVYEHGEQTAEYRTTYAFGELLLGTIFASRLSVVAGLRGEYIKDRVEIGAEGLPEAETHLVPFFGGIRLDTFDPTVFPTRGLFVDLLAEATSTDAGSDLSFTRYHADWRLFLQLHRKVTLLQTLYLGTTAVGESPLAYRFMLGGLQTPFTYLGPPNWFLGLKRHERSGANAQTFGIGLQWECYRRTYALLRWNIGNTFEEWNSNPKWDDYVHGGGITLGLNIPAAPIEFTLMTSTEHDILFQFTIGYYF